MEGYENIYNSLRVIVMLRATQENSAAQYIGLATASVLIVGIWGTVDECCSRGPIFTQGAVEIEGWWRGSCISASYI